jgi:hypothetical protein
MIDHAFKHSLSWLPVTADHFNLAMTFIIVGGVVSAVSIIALRHERRRIGDRKW